MLRLVLLCLVSFGCVLPLPAERLGGIVDVVPVAGWKAIPARAPGEPEPPMPTLKLVPSDGRNAAILLSLFPSQGPGYAIVDDASLREFNLLSARPYLAAPDAQPAGVRFELPDGLGIFLTNEDPALIGKPAPPGEYRIATTATILLARKWVIHGTIFHDEADSETFHEALRILKSVALPGSSTGPVDTTTNAPGSPPTLTRAGLRGTLTLPPDRFQSAYAGAHSVPGYFSFTDAQGTLISGWLDEARHFKGMKTFWAAERDALVARGFPIADEVFKIVKGWNTVSYTVVIGGFRQVNLRACRVVDDTWADLHLSTTDAVAGLRELENVLGAIGFEAR